MRFLERVLDLKFEMSIIDETYHTKSTHSIIYELEGEENKSENFILGFTNFKKDLEVLDYKIGISV